MRTPWDGGKRVALSPHPNNVVSTNSTDHKMTAQRLDEKGVSQIDTLGGKQETTVVNESGLYNVILRSDKLKSIWAAVLFK